MAEKMLRQWVPCGLKFFHVELHGGIRTPWGLISTDPGVAGAAAVLCARGWCWHLRVSLEAWLQQSESRMSCKMLYIICCNLVF